MEVSYVRNYLQSYMVICTNDDKNYEGKIIEENATINGVFESLNE